MIESLRQEVEAASKYWQFNKIVQPLNFSSMILVDCKQKMDTTILLIIFLVFTTIYASNPECKDVPYCECSENEMGDINSILISNNSFTFTIGVATWSNLQVDCNNLGWNKLNITRKEFVDVVDLVKFKNCHFPRESTLKEIVQLFGIKETNELSFQSYSEFSTEFKREHLEEFSDLIKLDLSHNSLTNISSDLFSNFSKLEFLDLSDNTLVLSEDIFNETLNLKQLNLNGNDITQLSPELFDNLKYLEILDLERNLLEELDSETFKELTSLKHLNLRSNFLSDLPEFIFSDLHNLETIDLSDNYFKSFQTNLFRENKKLKKVLLNNNEGELKILPGRFLNDKENLEVVELRRNHLNRIPENLFWDSISLKYIDLSQNVLRRLPESIFRDLQNIEKISLNKNFIRTLPDMIFAYVKKLKVLDLSYNSIKYIPRNVFHGLKSLEELYMDGNGLKFIHISAFLSNEQLSIAHFSNNLLSFHYKNEVMSPFYSNSLLKELHLSNNKINHFFYDWNVNKQSLRLLDLSYNKISIITEYNLMFSSEEIVVDLRYNNISNILLNNFELLEEHYTEKSNVVVYVNYNPILCDCNLYFPLRYCSNCVNRNVYNFVKLDFGNLQCLQPNGKVGPRINQLDFTTYQCLEDEYFKIGKKCREGCSCEIRPYDKTRIIDCSNKNFLSFAIKEKHINYFGKYPFLLNLRSNNMEMIRTLKGLETLNVTELLLSNNQFSEIRLDKLPKTIQVLELHNNNLVKLSDEVCEYFLLKDFKVLTLSGNPFICDCDARFLYRLVSVMQHSYPDFKNIKCEDMDIPLLNMSYEKLCPSYFLH